MTAEYTLGCPRPWIQSPHKTKQDKNEPTIQQQENSQLWQTHRYVLAGLAVRPCWRQHRFRTETDTTKKALETEAVVGFM